MACLCTDSLDDLSLKFDLILELVNTILAFYSIPAPAPATGGGGGGPAYAYARDYAEYDSTYKLAEIHRKKVLREDEEILEILAMIINTGIV